jgi:hypothetical protein
VIDLVEDLALAERRKRVVQVGLDEAEPPRGRGHVAPAPGGEIVDHRHLVAPREQALHQVRPDETGPRR